MEKKMLKEHVLDKYLTELLKGDRIACRAVIEETLQSGVPANSVYMDVVWPIMVEIDTLHRHDKINSAQEAFATRINRTIVDQLQNKLPRKAKRDKRIVVCSTVTEHGELGAQIMSDLFESDGWDARMLGGSVNNDDVLEFVQVWSPDILLFYGVNGKGAPQLRNLIDRIRTINAWPDMKIMLSGGVFNRAEGLWEEIGADLYAPTASEAVQMASDPNPPMPHRTINCRKKPAAPAQAVEAD
jgi:methanogenic corrinoid protein MtbC1